MKKFCLSAILAAVLMLPCAQAASAAEDAMGVYVAPRVHAERSALPRQRVR